MFKKEKVVMFGSGSYGRIIYERLNHYFEFTCFIDNDPNKHIYKIKNLNIYPPDILRTMDYDFIIIASSYEDEIISQLNRIGIDSNKVKSASEFKLESYFPWNSILLLISIITVLFFLISAIFYNILH